MEKGAYMTKDNKKTEWLDQLLQENFIYVDDDGFTDKVLKKINHTKSQRLKIELFIWLTAGFSLIAYIYKGVLNSHFISLENIILTTFQNIETMAYGITPLIGLVIVSFILIKIDV